MAVKPPNDDLAGEEHRLRSRLDANLTAAEKALNEATRTPTVKGSTGQRRPNPLFDVAAKADETAVRLCRELRELRQHRAAEEQVRRTRELLDPFAELDAAASG